MAKKKINIKVFTYADKQLYQLGYITGGFTKQQAKELGVNLDRFKSHVKDGYVKLKGTVNVKNDNPYQLYVLTDKGKAKCRELNDVGHAYKRTSELHDRVLRSEYIKSNKENNIVKWLTEKDLYDRLEEKIYELKNSNSKADIDRADELTNMLSNKLISMPDMAYVTESGETVVVEVITKHYKAETIQAKHEYINAMSYQYKEVKVN